MLLLPSALATTPNLLLLVADDVGADKVSSYAADWPGYAPIASYMPQTGGIDDLARAGLRFSQAWANPSCSPTRAALLTGRHPYRTGVTMPAPMAGVLNPETEVALPDILSARGVGDADGYATALFGKWHLGTEGARRTTDWSATGGSRTVQDAANPLRFGFQYFDGSLDGQVEDYFQWTRVISDGGATSEIRTETTYATEATVDAALGWIKAQRQPWFAMVAFNAAHSTGNTRTYREGDVDPGCPPGRPVRTDANTERGIHQSLTECMDTHIVRLLQGIPEAALSNTLIVFIGDNGTERTVLEGPFLQSSHEVGKTTLYESGIHVPLIMTDGAAWLAWRRCSPDTRAAGTCVLPERLVSRPGRVEATPVQAADLYATLGAAAGADIRKGLDSRSLLDCLAGKTSCRPGAVYAEMYRSTGQNQTGDAAARVGNLKVIAHVEQNGCRWDEAFDLAKDPFEENALTPTPSLLDALAGPWLDGRRTCTEDEKNRMGGGFGGRPGGGRPGGFGGQGGGQGGGPGPRRPR